MEETARKETVLVPVDDEMRSERAMEKKYWIEVCCEWFSQRMFSYCYPDITS